MRKYDVVSVLDYLDKMLTGPADDLELLFSSALNLLWKCGVTANSDYYQIRVKLQGSTYLTTLGR